MKVAFKQFKKEFLELCKKNNACQSEFKRVLESETIEQLLEVITDNISWCKENVFNKTFLKKYGTLLNNGTENTGYLNSGYRNSGDRNSGDRNSGYRNSGDRNSGDLNSGDRNSGDLNSGYLNSGYRNSGDLNSGYLNSGYQNSGDRNSGDLNSGDRNSGYLNSGYLNSGDLNSGDRNSGDRNSGDLNSGDRNSGYLNSGYLNSGDLNSGYRNSGVFCNRKKEDKIIIFNKKSNLTWQQWLNHPVYNLCFDLKVTEWINWNDMTSEEKENNKAAFVCGGYIKTYDYKEAWKNLWKTFTKNEKELFKTLPNFDAEVFEDITGIKL